MKKCIVVSDSFKGTLSSLDICAAARRVIPECFPGCEAVTIPVADGGEGTVDCFIEAMGASPVTVEVTGVLGTPVAARYARLGGLAVVEMAAAAGLPLAGSTRSPGRATTFGVGKLIAHAVRAGCTTVLLGLGGSATNDGGCGCAAALGVKFFDGSGAEFVPVGDTLCDIAHIDVSAARELLRGVELKLMCDVTNPLCGEKGAAHVFGPQKGADAETLRAFFSELYESYCVRFGSAHNAMSRMKGLWFYAIHLFDDTQRYARRIAKARYPSDYEALMRTLFGDLPLRADARDVP